MKSRFFSSLFLLLTAMLMLCLPALPASASQATDYFDYTVLEDGTARITKFKGGLNWVDVPLVIEDCAVTEIGERAFYGSALYTVTLPSTLTSIGESAFGACRNLTSVTFGSGVASIGSYAFENCSALTAITLPEGLTTMGDHCFWGCSALESAVLPSTLSEIPYAAFGACKALTRWAIF